MFKFVIFLCVILCAQQTLAFHMNPMRNFRAISPKFMATEGAAKAKKDSNVFGKMDLLTKLQESTSYKKKDLEVVINAFIEVIKKDVLTEGHELRLRDFGTFRQKKTAPRTGRNPKTGESIQIGSSTSVTFSASSTSLRIKE